MTDHTAPVVDEHEKAISPAGIRKRTWGLVLRRTLHEFVWDECLDSAAALTFFSVLAVFPALLAIVSTVGVFGYGSAALDRVFELLDQVAPSEVTEILRLPLADAARASGVGITLLISVATAIWSASIYVTAFGRAMNRIHGVTEGRPYFRRKPMQLAITVGLMILVTIVGAIVVLSGPIARAVGGALQITDAALTAWEIVKWPLLFAAVVTAVTVLYKNTGNLRLPRVRWLGVGATLAIVIMGLASTGFAFYAANFASYNRTFGGLAAIIVFLIWLFLLNLALLLGAELNAELERGRQLQAGLPAESALQLPLRDDTVIERRARRKSRDEEQAADMRAGRPFRPSDGGWWRRAVSSVRAWFARRRKR